MQQASSHPADPPDSQPTAPASARSERTNGTPNDPSLSSIGGLPTSIVQADHIAQVVKAAQKAQTRTQNTVKSISDALTALANKLHAVTKKLSAAVYGPYAADPGDPLVALLIETLHAAEEGDWQLARISEKLNQLDESVQSSQSSIGTLQREREMLATLYRVAQELNSTLDLETVLGQVMDKVIEVVKADRGFLLLYNEATRELEFTIARNKDQSPVPKSESKKISRSRILRVWKNREPVVEADAVLDPRFANLSTSDSVISNGIRSILCVPLLIQDRPLGIVYVDNLVTANPYNAEHLDLLAACCNQAAIAIDNARKVREITDFKNLLDNIFRSIASGVITLDTKGKVQLVNRAAERILLLPAEQALGQLYQTVFSSLGQEKIIEVIDRAKADDSTILNREMDCELPNRGKVSLSINISPLRDKDNKETGIVMAVEDLTEMRTWRDAATNVKRIFQRYVHPSVVEQLMRDPDAVKLGGQTKEVSILFADIRGYTALSHNRPPEEVVEMLNEYLQLLTEAIWKEEGTITMFVGDAIMAIFNAPLSQPDHSRRAVNAALGMRQAILDRQSKHDPGYPEVKYGITVNYGIGVTTGLATVGNVGSARLQNYTAMGDAVNIASRLQSNSSDNEIIIHETTYEQVSDSFECVKQPPLKAKNIPEPLKVYKVVGLKASDQS